MKYTGWILFGPFLVVAMHISSTPAAAQDFPLYSTEDAGSRVGKIDASGTFEVFASGLAGSFGVTVGPDGFVYVAEIDGDQVSRIDILTGVVTVFACNLTVPTGVWFGPDGRLYCTEGNGEVTDISAGGDMSGVTPFASGFNFPTGLAFDDDGTMYVADLDAHFGAPPYPQGGYAGRGVPISKVDANGQVTTFVDLDPLCVVGSNVFPVDLLCNVVNIEFGTDGVLYATQFGGAGSGVFRVDSSGQEVLLAKPGNSPSDNMSGLAIHKDGTLYVGDGGCSEIYRVDPTDGTSSIFSVIVGNSPFGLAFTPSNTTEGIDTLVEPVDATTGATPATLTFAQVTTAGTSTLTTSGSGEPPPSGFQLGDPPTYYEIATTAEFVGLVEICIEYSGVSFGDESALKLFHFESGVWVDVTTSLDTTNDIICGTVTSLSPFVIFEAEDSDGDGVNDADDACPDSDLSATIVINGNDTGVENELAGDGCSLSDLIAELLANDASTADIVQFLVDLKGDGIISGQEMGAILRALNSP